jgi:hypothetical protein
VHAWLERARGLLNKQIRTWNRGKDRKSSPGTRMEKMEVQSLADLVRIAGRMGIGTS